MGMASGEREIYKAPDFFFLLKGDTVISYPMCLHSKCSNFCGEFNYG